jgi:hypothetical protein
VATASRPTSGRAAGRLKPDQFFDLALDAFRQARDTTGAVDRYYRIGDLTVHLSFAGPALVPKLTPALAHLETVSGKSSLTVHLWDSASSGVKMPPPPWSRAAYGVRGSITGYDGGVFHTVYDVEAKALLMMDAERSLALYWLPAAELVPSWASSYPLQLILHWWSSRQALHIVHAAAVGVPSAGVLITGKGGSGKSTTHVACLDSELLSAADDKVIVRLKPGAIAYSLYNTIHLRPDTVSWFPHLAAALDPSAPLEREKVVAFLHDHLPEKLSRGFPLRAILVPRVTGLRDTRLTLASPVKALTALAPTSLFQAQGQGHAAFRAMSELVKAMPCYELEVGTDLSQIPDAVLRLLRELEP